MKLSKCNSRKINHEEELRVSKVSWKRSIFFKHLKEI
jgi:hypothetical protein